MSKSGKTAARRASALLMSALLAFSTCPVEALGQTQDNDEAESPVLLVDDDGVTTDEMGNFAQELPPTEPIEDEILDQTAEDEAEPLEEDLNQTPEDTDEAGQPVGEETQGTEEPTTSEDSQETSEQLSIEPIREQSTGTMLVDENPSGKSYFFDLSDEADKTTAKVKVYGVTSGNVSYDAATGTLQLNNANVNGEIESDGDITLELVGSNTVCGYDSFYEGSYYDNEAREYVYYDNYSNGYKNSYDAAIDVNGMLTVNSDGSINTYYSVSCTSLEIKNGTINGSINTNGGNANVSGGTIGNNDGYYSIMTNGGNATVSGGTVDGINTDKRSADGNHIGCGDLTISNGNINGSVSCGKIMVEGKATINGYVYCSSFIMKGGKVNGEVSTGNGGATVYGGTVNGNVRTNGGSATVSGGTVGSDDYYGVYTDGGSATVSGGTIINGISCGKLTITGGTIYEYDNYDANDHSVSCTSLEMKGGKIEGDLYTNGGNAIVSGGSIAGWFNTSEKWQYGSYDNAAFGSVIITNGTIGNDISCGILSISNGIISGTVCCDALTISNGTIDGTVSCDALIMRGGSISITGDRDEWYKRINTKQLSMTGGSINGGVDASDDGIVSISGGTISGGIGCGKLTLSKKTIVKGGVDATTITMNGGSVGGIIGTTVNLSAGSVSGNISCGTFTMTGGSVNYKGTGANDNTTAVSCTTLTIKGGSIKASRCGDVISCKKMTMAGGSIRADNCDGGIEATEYADAKTASITIKKGKIVMNNPNPDYRGCISSSHGNITIKGGTITIKGSYGGGITAYGSTYRGKRYGGKVKITGGKLTIINRSAQSSAIYADSITNKPGCLKKIVGRLSTGARFKSGGNTYQVSDYSGVNIYRYGSKKKEAKFKQITFGKNKYSVSGIAAKAFNTKRGAALTSITFQNSIHSIGANAFKGTKSLKNLVFRSGFNGVYTNWSGSKYKLKVDKQYFKCNKKAFSGAGAKGGNSLTVAMQGDADNASLYRSLLLKKGLSKGAKVTATYFYN